MHMKKDLVSKLKGEGLTKKVPKRFRVVTEKQYRELCRSYGETMEKAFGCSGIKKLPTIIDTLTRKPIPYFPKVVAYA